MPQTSEEWRLDRADERTRAFGAAFDRACSETAAESVDLELGGLRVRLRLVGGALAACVQRPFAHLVIPADGTPDLTIDLWDEVETGIAGPETSIDDSMGIANRMQRSDDGRYLSCVRARSEMIYDRRDRRIVGWTAYGDRTYLHEMGRPFQELLSFWFVDVGRVIMHASLVARDGAGILFPGMSGSGKSTCALACLDAGFHYLGDDQVVLSRDDAGGFRGHAIYCSSLVDPDHLQRFGILTSDRLTPDRMPPRLSGEDKTLLMLDDAYPESLVTRSVPISAMVLPRVVDADETQRGSCSRAEMLLALAPSTIVLIPGNRGAALADLSALIESVPCHRLHLGRRIASIPERVSEIVETVNAT